MQLETRVLHFGRFDSDAYGGLERHVRSLLAGLKNHMQVDNLVAADSLGGPMEEVRDGYTVFRAPSWGLIASTALSPQLLWQARRLERRHHYDIIHLHFPDPLSHLATVLFPRATKVVISWHSDIVRQEKLLTLYRPFVDRLLARAGAVIAATPAHFESSTQVQACPLERRKVVPYGIDYRVYEANGALLDRAAWLRASYGSKRLIFAVGRHVYYKGFEYLIRAMREIQGLLLLGGSGPLTNALRGVARDAGVSDRVHFLGRVPDADMPAYYHAADVFCLPSVERSEQFGLVQLEAMACRKPVVCCELHNGVTYVNQDGVTGIVVPPRSPEALARAINTLLDDEALSKRLGEAGYRRATGEFSLEKMISGTLAVYDRVLGEDGLSSG